MKKGVLLDSHDQGELIRKAVEHFNKEQVERVFQCGDWVAPLHPLLFPRFESSFMRGL